VASRAAVAEHVEAVSIAEQAERLPGFHVVIAGAGISGLTLALGLLKKGIKVTVLERDLTAIRGEGKLRGPIQVRATCSSPAQLHSLSLQTPQGTYHASLGQLACQWRGLDLNCYPPTC
jgi:pyruvate/2-oxoglutarate dehydrogenase complex dihydrolipoamide dehydrogenase (E3) component